MTLALMLDTSALISLVDDSRRHHLAARQYFVRALERGIPMHVSTLALAEFAYKQAITDLPLRQLRIEPFNVQHAVTCGRLWAALMPKRDLADRRDVVKADIQLLAQAEAEGIPLLLAEDENTMSKYAGRIRDAGLGLCQVVLLAKGFDDAWFNNGQRTLPITDINSPPSP